MSKVKGTVAPPTPQISVAGAVQLLNQRIQKLDQVTQDTFKAIERKIGDQDQFVSDNIVDMAQINTAFTEINNRLLEVEHRLSALEGGTEQPKTVKKNKGTVKVDF